MTRKMDAQKKLLSLFLGFGPLSLSALTARSLLQRSHTLPWMMPLFTSEGLKLPSPLGTGMIRHKLSLFHQGEQVAWNFQTSRFKGGVAIPVFGVPFNTAEVRLEGGLLRLPAGFFSQSCVTGPLLYLKPHSVGPMQLQLGWKWTLANRISLELLHRAGTTSELSLDLRLSSQSEPRLPLRWSETLGSNAAHKKKSKAKGNRQRPPAAPSQTQSPTSTTENREALSQADPVISGLSESACNPDTLGSFSQNETAVVQACPPCKAVGTEEDEGNISFLDLHKLESYFDHPPSQGELERLKRRLTEHQQKLVHAKLSERDNPFPQIEPKLWKFSVHQFVKQAEQNQVQKLLKFFDSTTQGKEACQEVVTYKSKNKSSLLHAAALNKNPGVFEVVYRFVQSKLEKEKFIQLFSKQNVFQCTFLHCFAQSQASQGNTDGLIQFLRKFFKEYPTEYKNVISARAGSEGTFLNKLAQFKRNNRCILKVLNDKSISSELFGLDIWDGFLFSSLQMLRNRKGALGELEGLAQIGGTLYQGMGEERFLKLLNEKTDSYSLKSERSPEKNLLHCMAERYSAKELSTFLSKLINWFPNHPMELNEFLISQDRKKQSFLHIAATKIKDSSDFKEFKLLVDTLLEMGFSSEALLCINNEQGSNFLEEVLFRHQNPEDIRGWLISMQNKLHGTPHILRKLLCPSRSTKNVWRFLSQSTTPGMLGLIFTDNQGDHQGSLNQTAKPKKQKPLASLFPLFCCLVEGDEFTQVSIRQRFKDWEESFKSFQSFPGLKEALKVRNHSGESFLQVILNHTERDHRNELLKILTECHSWLVHLLGEAEGAEVFENLLSSPSSHELHKAVERCTLREFSDYFIEFTPEEKEIALHAFMPFFSQRDESGNTFVHNLIKKTLENKELVRIAQFIRETKDLIPYRGLLPLRNHSGENCLDLILRHYVHHAPKSSNLKEADLESLLKVFKSLLGEDYFKLFTSTDCKSEEGGFCSWFLIPPQDPASSLDAFNTVLKLLLSSCRDTETGKFSPNALKALKDKIRETNKEGDHLLHILMKHYAKPSYGIPLKNLVDYLKIQLGEEGFQALLNQKNNENQGFIDIAFVFFDLSDKPSSSFEEEFKRFVAIFSDQESNSDQSNFVATLAWKQINHWSPNYPGERLKKVLKLLPKSEVSKRKEDLKIALEKVILNLGANRELSADTLGEIVREVELYCQEEGIKLFDTLKENSVLLQLFECQENQRSNKKSALLTDFLLNFFEGYFNSQKDKHELARWLWESSSEKGTFWHKAAEQVNQQGGKGADTLPQLLKLFLNQKKSLETLAIRDEKGRTFLDILVEQPNHGWEAEKVTEKCKSIGEALAYLHHFLLQSPPPSTDHPISRLLLNQGEEKGGLLLKAVASLSVQGLSKLLEQYGSTLKSELSNEGTNPIDGPSPVFRDFLKLKDEEGNSFLHIAARLSGEAEDLGTFIDLIKAIPPSSDFIDGALLRNKHGKNFLEEFFLAWDPLSTLIQSKYDLPFSSGEPSLLNFMVECKKIKTFEENFHEYLKNYLKHQIFEAYSERRLSTTRAPAARSRLGHETTVIRTKSAEEQQPISELLQELTVCFGKQAHKLIYPTALSESSSLLLRLFERKSLDFKDFCRSFAKVYSFIRNISHYTTLLDQGLQEKLLATDKETSIRERKLKKKKHFFGMKQTQKELLFTDESSATFEQAFLSKLTFDEKVRYRNSLEKTVSITTNLLLLKQNDQGDTVFHCILKRFGVSELDKFTHYYNAVVTLYDPGSQGYFGAHATNEYVGSYAYLLAPPNYQGQVEQAGKWIKQRSNSCAKHLWSTVLKLFYSNLMENKEFPENHPFSIERKIIEKELSNVEVDPPEPSPIQLEFLRKAFSGISKNPLQALMHDQIKKFQNLFLELLIDLGEEALVETTLRSHLEKALYKEEDIKLLLSISRVLYDRRFFDNDRMMLQHLKAFLVQNKENESVCSMWSRMLLEQKEHQKIRALRERFERIAQLSSHAPSCKDPLLALSPANMEMRLPWIKPHLDASDWRKAAKPEQAQKEWEDGLDRAFRTIKSFRHAQEVALPSMPEIKALQGDFLSDLQKVIAQLRQAEVG